MIIKDILLTPNPYSRRQKKNFPKKIVIHYVGNPGSSAIANRNYFESLKSGFKQSAGSYRYASSHYVIGLLGEIIRCIPEDEEAIHASDGEVNSSSIGIENCHANWTGKFNDSTMSSLIELCVDICIRYKLNPLTDIYRHFDIPKANHKDCPRWFVSHPEDFEKLKLDIFDQIKKQRVDETIIALGTHKRKDGIRNVSDSPEVWRKAFMREEKVNMDNMLILFRRAMGLE